MDVPHRIIPRKLRLSRPVDFVPQLGHRYGIVSLAFEPQRGLLAVLDQEPCVRVWSTEAAEILLIAPLPCACQEIRWTSDARLAALQRNPDGELWWQREVRAGQRWQACAQLEDEAIRYPRILWESDSSRLEVGGTGRAPSRQELGETDQAPNRQELGDPRSLALPERVSLAVVDPLSRFVCYALADELRVLDFDSEKELCRHPLGAPVTGLALLPSGEAMLASLLNGEVHRIDPLRPDRNQPLCAAASATCLAYLPSKSLLAVGEEDAHVSLFDANTGRKVLRTGRRVPGFVSELVAPDGSVYVGLRVESYTAELAEERSILPIRPLPAPLASAALTERELLVALEDGRVVGIEVEKESIIEYCRFEKPLRLLAASADGFVGVDNSAVQVFDGIRSSGFEWENADSVCTLAIDRAGKHLALADAAGVTLVELANGERRHLALPAVQAMAFTRRKGKAVLAVIDAGRVLWCLELGKQKPSRIGVLELEGRLSNLSQILCLGAERDGTLRLLGSADNEQRVIASLDVNTARASQEAALMVLGTQIVMIHDEDGPRLRQDEERGVRFVSELQAYEPGEYMREVEAGLH